MFRLFIVFDSLSAPQERQRHLPHGRVELLSAHSADSAVQLFVASRVAATAA